jgi:hypothetical protein
MQNKIEQLKAYAEANYQVGGHWIVETHDAKDYEARLAKVGGDVEAAKASMQRYWQLLEVVESDIANS